MKWSDIQIGKLYRKDSTTTIEETLIVVDIFASCNEVGTKMIFAKVLKKDIGEMKNIEIRKLCDFYVDSFTRDLVELLKWQEIE